MNLEEIVFTIILHAGNAKGIFFEALDEAKNGDFNKAQELMKQGEDELLKAHEIQTKMLQDEAGGNKHEVTLLMVHAQDHLMNASLAQDLISEIVELYKNRD